ncbi:hypothetical protein GCM10022290_00080 [Sagittula marina]
MPENASAKSYCDGWECNIGFRLNEDTCVAVVVPQSANDAKRFYGSGWEWAPISQNARLDRAGNRWGCNKISKIKAALRP